MSDQPKPNDTVKDDDKPENLDAMFFGAHTGFHNRQLGKAQCMMNRRRLR